jgi:hypothetical protein
MVRVTMVTQLCCHCLQPTFIVKVSQFNVCLIALNVH